MTDDNDNFTNDDDDLLSVGQTIGLFCAAGISISLSLFGSCCVIYIARKRAWEEGETYHRIVSILSIIHIVLDVSVVFGAVSVPKELPGRHWSLGNMTICSILGSVTTFAFLAFSLLNAGLSVYFWLIVRRNWTNVKIKYWMELPMYMVTFTLSIGLAVAGFVTDSYNYINLAHQCVIKKAACVVDASDERQYGDYDLKACADPGSIHFSIIEVVYVFWVLVAPIVGFTATISVYRYVRLQLGKTRTRSMTSASSNLANDVSWQAIWYSIVYSNSFLWPFMIALVILAGPEDNYLGREGEAQLFLVQFLVFLFTPISGWLNFIVYIRPKFNQWRMVIPPNSLKSVRKILKNVLQDKPLPRRTRHRRPPTNSRDDNNKTKETESCGIPSSIQGGEKQGQMMIEMDNTIDDKQKNISPATNDDDEKHEHEHETNDTTTHDLHNISDESNRQQQQTKQMTANKSTVVQFVRVPGTTSSSISDNDSVFHLDITL